MSATSPVMMILRRSRLLLALAACMGPSLPVVASSSGGDGLIYIGSHEPRIEGARFDPASGVLRGTGSVADVPRPTWIIRHPRLPVLYSVSEEGGDGAENGTIIAFGVDRKTGALTRLNQVDAGGAGTTFLSFDRRSMTLVAANYGGGSVSTFPILKDGRIGPLASVVAATGSGPHRRQTKSHAHSAMVDPSGRFVIAADLGTDHVYVYPFDARTHQMRPDAPGQERHYEAQPGSGPRHFAFHPDGRWLYLVNELTADIQLLGWDAREGRLTLLQSQTTNAPDHQGGSSASAIAVSADGWFVYVANRAENALLVYAVEPRTGTLSLVQHIASGGDYPWAFGFDASGRWLLVAHQRSNQIATFAVDRDSGMLTAEGAGMDTPRPVSITSFP